MRYSTVAWQSDRTGEWILGSGYCRVSRETQAVWLSDDIANGNLPDHAVLIRLPRKVSVSKLRDLGYREYRDGWLDHRRPW